MPHSHARDDPMTIRALLVAVLLCAGQVVAFGQEREAAAPRYITLREALDLASQNNHRVRMSRSAVDEKQRAKDVARSAYFPTVRTDSSFMHVTGTQLVEIPAGGLGLVGSNQIPPHDLIINQGALSTTTFGTGVTQPLTQLLRVRAANDMARAEVRATAGQARQVENVTALSVHQMYYRILIAEVRRGALQAKIRASDDLQSERVQQVKYGSALDADLIESRAQWLQAKQELLSTDLQLSDLHMQFNDAIGLPLASAVTLDPNVAAVVDGSCARDECVSLALESHPEIAEARGRVDSTASAVQLAKYEFVPDIDVFARYSHQNNVPFLAPNFATFGVRLSYELFSGGRKRSTVREREAQLSQARENLARISDDVELRVQTAYNKLDRTRQMIAVSEELLALRAESRRTTVEQVAHGSALRSQSLASVAQELDAKAVLLQSQLDYVQAAAEMDEAVGRTPR
jgi:outer membrane protein TolC